MAGAKDTPILYANASSSSFFFQRENELSFPFSFIVSTLVLGGPTAEEEEKSPFSTLLATGKNPKAMDANKEGPKERERGDEGGIRRH